jgi:hypothetical protein
MKKIVLMLAAVLVLSGYALAQAETAIPIYNLKGCWVMDYILANSGGGPQLGSTPAPWYYQPARKAIGSTYVDITHQGWNSIITGTYYTWFSAPFKSPGFISCPFEGSVIASQFSLYTASDPAPYGGDTEELRFLQGFITRDSVGKVIYGAGTVSRDMDVSGGFNYVVFHFNFVMRPYPGTCPGPNPGSAQAGPTACPWYVCEPPTPPPTQ